MESYRLRDILTRDSELACEWLGKRRGPGMFTDRDLSLLVADFDDQQRLALLDQISADPMASDLLYLLIDRRPGLVGRKRRHESGP